MEVAHISDALIHIKAGGVPISVKHVKKKRSANQVKTKPRL